MKEAIPNQIIHKPHYAGVPVDNLPVEARDGIRRSLVHMMKQDLRVRITTDLLDSDRYKIGDHQRVFQTDLDSFQMAAFRSDDGSEVARVFVSGPVDKKFRDMIGGFMGYDANNSAATDVDQEIGGRVVRQSVLIPKEIPVKSTSVNIPNEAERPIEPAYGAASKVPYRLTAEEVKILHGDVGEIGGIEGLIRQDVIDKVKKDQEAIEQRFGKVLNEAEPEHAAEQTVEVAA